MNRDRDLPSFKSPPVYEVAIGIGFQPLQSWTSVAPGEFYQSIKDRFPKVEDQPPLAPISLVSDPTLQLDLVLPPVRRVWFVSEDDSLLIQVQANRLHVNWRKTEEIAQYPRYGQVLDLFFYALQNLEHFANQRGENLTAVAGEVTYVNHIPAGVLWQDWTDLRKVFRDWSVVPTNLGGVNAVSCILSYEGTQDKPASVSRGNSMNVEIRTGRRLSDDTEVLTLQLTNRGLIPSSDLSSIQDWVDVASADIVRMFTNLTSEQAHKNWGRLT